MKRPAKKTKRIGAFKGKFKINDNFFSSNLKRGPQVILSKDCAMILAYTGVQPGAKIVDAGTGSGFLAIFLATYIRPGKVYTYEIDKKAIEIAKGNIKSSGLSGFVHIREADVTRGIKEKNVDLITLDLKDAKKAIGAAHRALKPEGKLVVYSPTVEHLLGALKEVKKKFNAIRIIEVVPREWKSDFTTRPETIGIMHTGFLTFAGKKK